MRHSAPRLQLRFRSSAKSIAACRMHLQKKVLKKLHVCCDVLSEKLGLGAKPATPKNVRHSAPAPQNQLHSAKCNRPKICTVGCEVLSGVFHAFQLRYFSTASAAPQNQANCIAKKNCTVGCDALREKLGLGAKPATPCEDRQPPQNQLQLVECTCRKRCMVGCDVIRGVGALKVC